jgi:deoxycytidylate deaminase
MKSLNNAGIKEIVYFEEYERIKSGGKETEREDEAKELADRKGIKLRRYEGGLFLNKNE